MAALIERGRLSLSALAETDALGPASVAVAVALQRTAIARREDDLTALDADIARAERRDLLMAGRPEGCACLGLGGSGTVLIVARMRYWQRPCGCPDGLALRAAQDRAAAEAEREEAARRAEEARLEAMRDLMARLAFANLPGRVAHDFADFGADPAKAGAVLRLRAFASGEKQRGVVLWGDFGTAKTTLAVSALRAWIQAGGRGLFVPLADYLESLRPQDGRTPPIGSEQASRARTIGLLALDDLGAERLTQWGRDALFRLVNARYDAGLPLIATSNYSLDELVGRIAGDDDPREGRRIVERIAETCDVLELRGCNYRRLVLG